MSSECQHVRELMDSYLSGELSVETNHEVLGHLDVCHECGAEVRRRQRLRRLLVQALDTDGDVDRVRERIARAIDREPRARAGLGRWSGIAATLIVGVGIAAWWLSRPVDAAAYDDSVGNHIACALAMPEVTYDPARAARSLAPPFEHIAEAIGLRHGNYEVVDAHMCPYKGRDYAHVVLRGGGRTLSLFVEPAAHGSLPTTAVRTALAEEGGVDVLSTARMGYRVSAAATPAYRLFVVAERPDDPPDAVTSEILSAAVRFVHTLEH